MFSTPSPELFIQDAQNTSELHEASKIVPQDHIKVLHVLGCVQYYNVHEEKSIK
jgi:hypothetical protein